MHGQAWPKLSKIQTLAQIQAQSYVWPNSQPEIRMQPQKGANITFSSFPRVNSIFFYLLCPVIMKIIKLAIVLCHRCSRVLNTFPWHNRVPEPISESLVYFFSKTGPLFQNFQKYKDIFSYLYRDPNTCIIVRWWLWKHTWPIFFPFFKN